MHTKLRTGVQNNSEINTMIMKAERKETELIFHNLKAVEPVKKEGIPEGIPAYNTHLFTIDAFKADGSRDKLNSRLVAHRNEKNTTLYPDRSSPQHRYSQLLPF
jgi:hypothetical protein